MARIVSPLLLLPLMFACSGATGAAQPRVLSSQESYEYGTCPKCRDECPHDRTLACALQAIASRHDACAKDEDCVAATLEARCADAGTCPPLYVNREMKSRYEAEAQKEIDRYCEKPTCNATFLCWVTGFRIRCVNSRCTWSSLGVRAGP